MKKELSRGKSSMIAVHFLHGGIADEDPIPPSTIHYSIHGTWDDDCCWEGSIKIAKAILRLRHEKRRRDEYDTHIGMISMMETTTTMTTTTTGGWGCLSNHKNAEQASERASEDGMAMVFSFLFYIPLIHSFFHFTFYMLCWLACPPSIFACR